MSQGTKPDNEPIKLGDTADLYGSLRIDGQPVGRDQIAQANFIVQKPGQPPVTEIGVIQDDGQAFMRWTDTSEAGNYRVQVQFTLVSGEVRSVMTNFSVIDPFADTTANPTPQELITQGVWLRIEDLIDSDEGGPWLRERTQANFDENKIAALIPEALMDINTQMPPTVLDIAFFTNWSTFPGDNPNMPILVQATLVKTIKHLMRSYTEQWPPTGAQVVWPDRTRYQQAWKAIYDIEYQDYISLVRMWKRTMLHLGHSALSIFNRSGRQWPYSNQRARGAYRGYN